MCVCVFGCVKIFSLKESLILEVFDTLYGRGMRSNFHEFKLLELK